MKKICLLMLCFGLTACDNSTIVGKCLPNERSTTTTEQNGKIVETTTTNTLLCGCFENIESSEPLFMISKETFSFQSETATDSKCDDLCVELCKTQKK